MLQNANGGGVGGLAKIDAHDQFVHRARRYLSPIV
jgi:hypothetical protein